MTLVRDAHPELIAELAELLRAEGEYSLAVSVLFAPLVGYCDCGDDFCRSIYTAEHPPGAPYGYGHRTIALLPGDGMLNIDVVHDRIMYIEVLFREL